MKYFKMFGLAALAAALMAFVVVGTASATTLTDGTGSTLGVGAEIKSNNAENVVLHPPIGEIVCSSSVVEGKVGNAGGANATVTGSIDHLTFASCNATVTVLQNGSLEIHTQETNDNNNGTLTSTGTEVTVEFSGFHCIFKTSSTDLGTLTGSANTGGAAKLDIAATIPRTGGRSGAFCGSTAQWTGSYTVTSPSALNVH